jgi:hypothetical protein
VSLCRPRRLTPAALAARRANALRSTGLYGQIRSRIAQTFGASTPEQRSWCEGLATEVGRLAIHPQVGRLLARTNLKTDTNQASWILRIPSHQQIDREGIPQRLRRQHRVTCGGKAASVP